MTAFDYLIIVGKEDLMQSVYPLKVWKEQIGHSVKVASISDIYSQYTGDDATRIWKFLHYYYSRWGLRYVLLVGDIDQLPMRILYQDDVNGGYGSDYYYAKLSLSKWNDWDIDGDKRWGEFNDDNLDPTPDVLVGRIPFNDPKVVSNICLSIINFEQDIGSWKRNALLAHGIDDYNPGGKTDSAVLAEYLKSNVFDPQGWNCTTLYEKNGIPQGQSTYTCDYPLSETNFQKCYQLHDSSIINLAAHGDPALMQSHYWLKDIDGDGKAGEVDDVPEWGNTNFSEIKNLSAHAKSAANSNSAVVFLLGCSTGAVLGGYKDLAASNLYSSYLIKKPWDCIAKQYMRNGAAAVIASTAMAYYQQNWSQPSHGKCQSLNYYFYDHLVNKDKNVGDAFYDAMVQFADLHGLDRGIRVFNFFGDPSLNLKGIENRPGSSALVHEGIYFNFAADNSENGELYVAVQTSNSEHMGQITIYKSSDHGNTWLPWSYATLEGVGVFDIDVAVANADKRLLLFCACTDSSLRVFRWWPLSGPASHDEIIIDKKETKDSFFWKVCAARMSSSSPNIYVAYEVFSKYTKTTAVHVCRSLDSGATWQDFSEFNHLHSPSIDFGPNVYLVARKYDPPPNDIYFTRSLDLGVSWENWINLTGNDGAIEHRNPVVATTTHADIPTVWVTYEHIYQKHPWKSEGGLRYAHSLNAGASWTENNILSGLGTTKGLAGGDVWIGSTHMRGYKAEGPNPWVNLAYLYNPAGFARPPMVIWRCAHGAVPIYWSAQRIVSHSKNVTYDARFSPRIVYSPGSPAPGSGVVYGCEGSSGHSDVYFSAPWLVKGGSIP